MCLTTWRGFVDQTKNQTANVTTPNLKILSPAVASPIKEGKHKTNPLLNVAPFSRAICRSRNEGSLEKM